MNNIDVLKRGSIDVSNHCNGKLSVSIEFENGTIWLTHNEIARLLGVHIQNITSNICAIFKRGDLLQCDVESYHRGTYYYNFDLFITLIFRVQGGYSQLFRDWAVQRLKCQFSKHSLQAIYFQMNSHIMES